jgi:hypothetical protein
VAPSSSGASRMGAEGRRQAARAWRDVGPRPDPARRASRSTPRAWRPGLDWSRNASPGRGAPGGTST